MVKTKIIFRIKNKNPLIIVSFKMSMLLSQQLHMFKYLMKLAVMLTLLTVPLFGVWTSGESSGDNQWYYARSEITPIFESTIPESAEFVLDTRVVVACNESRELNVYMQFSDVLKLEQPIQIVNRHLYDIPLEFGEQYKKSIGAIYKKESTFLEFMEDESLTKDLRDGLELSVTLPWRNDMDIIYLVSLEDAGVSINDTLAKCGIDFDDGY